MARYVRPACSVELLMREADEGAGAAAMAFGIRAGVNVFLMLFRIKQVPR